jgi:hypothetical protein
MSKYITVSEGQIILKFISLQSYAFYASEVCFSKTSNDINIMIGKVSQFLNWNAHKKSFTGGGRPYVSLFALFEQLRTLEYNHQRSYASWIASLHERIQVSSGFRTNKGEKQIDWSQRLWPLGFLMITLNKYVHVLYFLLNF